MTANESHGDDLDAFNAALNAPDLDYAVDAVEDDDRTAGSCGECDTDALAQDHTRHGHLRADSVEVRSFDGRAKYSRPV